VTAIIGQFAPGGQRFRFRPVDLEGGPDWLLGQVQVMWTRAYRRDTARMVVDLMLFEWSVLAHTHWPRPLMEQRPHQWTYVAGIGRAHRGSNQTAPQTRELAEPPRGAEEWAYLWEAGCGALHVYVAAGRRWHHIATLPDEVFAELNEQLVMDIQQRQSWLEDTA